MDRETCVFTIVSKNYISYARVFAASFLRYHPGIRVFVLLADRTEGYFDPGKESFEVIEAHTLGIKDFESLTFKYNIVEFNTAVKPFFFEYLFSKFGFKKIIFFDPDILFFKELTEIFGLFERYSVLLIPHALSPLPDDGCLPADIDILKAGCFNLGFIALSDGLQTDRLLSWWKERVYDKALQAPLLGYDVDQIWMTLIPCFFDDYFILKNPGYNIAYWNLHERFITKEDGEFLVNNKPIYFFHFSGFRPDTPGNLSVFQDRFSLSSSSAIKELFEIYKNLLAKNGYHDTSKWPYSYGFFKNGSKISAMARRIYWGLGNYDGFGNPFISFYRKLFNVHNLSLVFKKRFMLAALDAILMHMRNKIYAKSKCL